MKGQLLCLTPDPGLSLPAGHVSGPNPRRATTQFLAHGSSLDPGLCWGPGGAAGTAGSFKSFLLIKRGKGCIASCELSWVSLTFQLFLMNADKADPLPLLSIKECGGVGPVVQTTVSPYSPADQQALKGD